jgi:hypothetical protein
MAERIQKKWSKEAEGQSDWEKSENADGGWFTG